MDRHTIDDQHIIPRYLAGQLTDAEAAAFETVYGTAPDAPLRRLDREAS